MSDLISREMAIEAVGDVHPLDYNGQAILDRIKALPTIDPVKHGEWVRLALSEIIFNLDAPITYYDHIRCSCCGKVFPKVLETMNYCGNCGARTRGEEDDSNKD